jgi:hypothetical protein
MPQIRIVRDLVVGIGLPLMIANVAFAQTFPGNVTCQDLLDIANGHLSRSTDGGRTYIPIKQPQPRDDLEKALIDYDTYLCRRISKREITAEQFHTLRAEKSQQLQAERQNALERERTPIQGQETAREIKKQTPQAESSRQARKGASHVLLVPASARQSGFVAYERRLADWRIVEKYENHQECESAKAMIAGFSHGKDRATSEAFMAGVCVNVEELKRVNRNY